MTCCRIILMQCVVHKITTVPSSIRKDILCSVNRRPMWHRWPFPENHGCWNAWYYNVGDDKLGRCMHMEWWHVHNVVGTMTNLCAGAMCVPHPIQHAWESQRLQLTHIVAELSQCTCNAGYVDAHYVSHNCASCMLRRASRSRERVCWCHAHCETTIVANVPIPLLRSASKSWHHKVFLI